MQCGVRLMGERCGEEIASVYLNFLHRLENKLGCHNGLLAFIDVFGKVAFQTRGTMEAQKILKLLNANYA